MIEVVRAYLGSSEDGLGFTTTLRFGNMRVAFLSDGRSIHAYLLDEKDEVSGATWLINLIESGDLPEWESQERSQYLNPGSCSRPFDLDRKIYQEKFHAHRFVVDGPFVWALYYGETIIGRVWLGAFPGDSVFATAPSPMAGMTPATAATDYQIPTKNGLAHLGDEK